MSDQKPQLSRAELANMPKEEVVRAHEEGRLASLLAGNDPGRPAEPFAPPAGADQGARGKTYRNAREWLASLRPEQVAELHRSGALDGILRGDHG